MKYILSILLSLCVVGCDISPDYYKKGDIVKTIHLGLIAKLKFHNCPNKFRIFDIDSEEFTEYGPRYLIETVGCINHYSSYKVHISHIEPY